MKVVTHLFCFLACTDHGSVASYSRPHSTSLLMQRLQALATINRTLLKTGKGSFQSSHSRCQSLDVEEGKDDMSSFPTNEDSEHALCQFSIFKSMPTDNQSSVSDQASALEMLITYPSSETQVVFSNFFYMVFVTASSYINWFLAFLMSYIFENAHLMGINFGSCLCFGQRLYFFWTWTCMWNSFNIIPRVGHMSFINDYKVVHFFFLNLICIYIFLNVFMLESWIYENFEELRLYLSLPVS